MYKVLIAEDEPPVLRYLSKIIEMKCGDFEVAATAENGQEALEILRKLNVDLLLTDAKMPVLDGIKLISLLRQEYPDILTVVISGYQNYEYVKQAFKSGTFDYILKPVQPSQMQKLFVTLKEKLDNWYYQKRQKQLQNILLGQPYDLEAWTNSDNLKFKVSIIRKNGLPSRNIMDYSDIGTHLFENIQLSEFRRLLCTDDVFVLDGRDLNETIIVCAYRMIKDYEDYRDYKLYTRILQNLKSPQSYYTFIFDEEFVSIAEIKERVKKLFNSMECKLIIGKNQVLSLETCELSTSEFPILDATWKNSFEYFLSNKDMDQTKNLLVKLFNDWEKQERTQIWVKKMIGQVVNIIERNIIPTSMQQIIDNEKIIEEATYCSTSFGELMAATWDVIDNTVNDEKIKNTNKKNTKDLFTKIEQYVNKNLSSQCTLQNVADSFGISQTYLSRLFRQYKAMSFNKYVTLLRIDNAKGLMDKNPSMLLKDVASIVGYQDPYYFSRVFKFVTGCSPSVYNKSLKSTE